MGVVINVVVCQGEGHGNDSSVLFLQSRVDKLSNLLWICKLLFFIRYVKHFLSSI